MRTDCTYDVPKPTDEEQAALDQFNETRKGDPRAWNLAHIAETGDAPPMVLKYVKWRLAHRAEWELGAADRPVTFEDHAGIHGRMRFFDGEWVEYGAIPTVIEANFPIVSGHDPFGYERHVECVWETYEAMIKADDEEGCRRLAGVFYEYLGMQGNAARMLLGAGKGERTRLAIAELRKALEEGTIKIPPGKAPDSVIEGAVDIRREIRVLEALDGNTPEEAADTIELAG